jgi:hypothetical protein
MDSVKLRKTHFTLGDAENQYATSSQIQSQDILEHGGRPASLDSNVKDDLRRSHFKFGNNNPQYQTNHMREYYDKSKLITPDNVNFNKVERGLRSTSYVLGDDKPTYLSEAAEKYQIPQQAQHTAIPEHKISTAQLQQSHYVFGNHNEPWVTTQRMAYVPKQVEHKRFTKNLTKTNFTLGDAEPTLKSVNQETFIRHPLSAKPINKDLSNDLRKHHFTFGNDDYPTQLTTMHKQTYKDPKTTNNNNNNVNNNKTFKKIDPNFLKESHWCLGTGICENPNEHYATTYDLSMVPKQIKKELPIGSNSTFKSAFTINGTGPMSYLTEQKAQFVPMENKINPDELKHAKKMIHDIKNSHFNLGEMQNDYATTMGNSYRFDKNMAKNAKGALDKELINDLRSTHYKLGYENTNLTTTHRASYRPVTAPVVRGKDPQLRDSHFTLGEPNKEKLEGKTIYMTDYVPKELPVVESDDDECF